jgi:hypothetical protein
VLKTEHRVFLYKNISAEQRRRQINAVSNMKWIESKVILCTATYIDVVDLDLSVHDHNLL